MLTYLTEGWFHPAEPQRLRSEVLDGAVDSAGLLARAGVRPATLMALKRVLTRCGPEAAGDDAAPFIMSTIAPTFEARREALIGHLLDASDGNVSLQAFMMDCLESAHDGPSWQALCNHLEHVALVLATLQAARANLMDAAVVGPVPIKSGRKASWHPQASRS